MVGMGSNRRRSQWTDSSGKRYFFAPVERAVVEPAALGALCFVGSFPRSAVGAAAWRFIASSQIR